jgi:hypothetical protein
LKIDLGPDDRTQVVYQPSNRGIDFHNFHAFNRAFDELDSDVNVCLEDDVVLDQDALELVDWFAELPNRAHYAWLSLGNFDKSWKCSGDPYPLIREEQDFTLCTAAFALARESWANMRERWATGLRTVHGWDWELSFKAWENRWKALTPVVSRCTNIGRVGIHSYVEFFDAHVAGALHSDGRTTKNFTIEERPLNTPEWVRTELLVRR